MEYSYGGASVSISDEVEFMCFCFLNQYSSQREYVLEALNCGKHVLLNDPISTSLSEFVEQQTLAKKYGKFIQFSTMFVHQFQGEAVCFFSDEHLTTLILTSPPCPSKVLRFINKVLGDEEFGWIHRIDATLHLSYQDVEKVGVKLPLSDGDGSIRVLGRFCVLVSTLFFSQVGSFAKSAKVENMELGEHGEITKATCTVKYTEVSVSACPQLRKIPHYSCVQFTY